MNKYKVTIGVILLLFIALGISHLISRNKRDSILNVKLNTLKTESGFYWDLKMYSYNELSIDSALFTLPHFSCVPRKLEVMKWKSIYDLDRRSFDDLFFAIEIDYPTIALINHINNNSEIYVSGLYVENKTSQIKKFRRAFFLDPANQLLYDFKYVGGEWILL